MKSNIKNRLKQLEQQLAASDAASTYSLSTETIRTLLDFLRRDSQYVDAARRAAVLHSSGDSEAANAIKGEAWDRLQQRIIDNFGEETAAAIWKWRKQ